MPTRYLRPGIRDSEAIDALSPLAECLFYRLLVTVDDFGRADARPAMVKAHCFPVKEAITAAKCEALLAELDRAGLVALYTADGKPVLQMQKWDNVPRAKASKFPAPSDACMQMHTTADEARTDLPGTGTGTGTDNREPEPDGANARKRASRKAPADFVVTDELRAWAAENAPLVDVDKATEKFRDHTFKTAMLDWPATWRNWLRKDQEFKEQRNPARAPAPVRMPKSFREADEEAARRRFEEAAGRAPARGEVIDAEPSQVLLLGGES